VCLCGARIVSRCADDGVVIGDDWTAWQWRPASPIRGIAAYRRGGVRRLRPAPRWWDEVDGGDTVVVLHDATSVVGHGVDAAKLWLESGFVGPHLLLCAAQLKVSGVEGTCGEKLLVTHAVGDGVDTLRQ
jgi:hypothetical protein